MAGYQVLRLSRLSGVLRLREYLEGFDAIQDLGEEFAGVGEIQAIDAPA